MTPTRLSKSAAPVAAATLVALLGCKLEPDTPELRHELNPTILADPTYEEFASDRAAREQLRGMLDLLVGSPTHPAFFLTEAMRDEEFDPNYQGGDLSEAEWEAILADNEVRFEGAIAAIAAGELDRVRLPREAVDLREDWDRRMDEIAQLEDAIERGTDADGAPIDAAALGEELAGVRADIQENWPTYLREYYPSLRESAEMYRTQCMHCHGVDGGGDGTTAPYLVPRPRDYRKGIFKFTSVADKARPTRADLYRVLTEGIYTTAMPSFRRFSDAQLHGLVDYVRLLSIRGRVESLAALDYDPEEGGLQPDSVFAYYDEEWNEWLEAPEHVIVYEGEVPEPTPELIARGRELYNQPETANCVSCHGTDHRGNGPSSKKQDPETGEMVQITDDWGYPIEPRDLNRGIYRFGRRPIDIFRRLAAGINGTPMPSHTTLTDAEGNRLLSDEDLWALVHYVRSLDTHAPAVARAQQPEEAGH